MNKIYVEVTTRIIMESEEPIDVDDVISNMTYAFDANTEGVSFTDTEIRDHKIKKIELKQRR